jgi:Tol biopolymer transport system component/predicted Ser/Thr protein kinase
MVGTVLNHYRITKALGSGGMGEVYLAEDTRLKRSVAIKMLPVALAADSDRRERFEREAQVIAALNHPNIVTVYSVEQAGDTHFLTMEYVDGRTLADHLPKGGLPLKRLLAIARQIVDAVIVAHDRGIVHRDLKPANVMVTANDRVKVLDFGLAKLVEAEEAAVAASMPTRELTGEGKIVGTVAYMSPEQAEGKSVDGRSDIFSLGVILYELATGDRPFKGDTSLSVLTSILRDTPKALTEANPRLPGDLARIVRHCLAKEPDRRYQSAKDLRNDLEELDGPESRERRDGAPGMPARDARRWPASAVAAGAIIAAVVAVVLWERRAADRSGTDPPSATYARLTQTEGVERFPSLSPDGKWVVYNAAGDIYLQSVTGQTAINLTKDSPVNDTKPAFSPDGELIAFRSERDGGGIFLMGRTGESVRRLTTVGYDPAWFSDGRQIVYVTGDGPAGPEDRIAFAEMWIVSTTGGEPRRLFAGDAVQPRVSPHAMRIAFWSLPSDAATKRAPPPGVAANRDIWTIDVNGEHPVRVTTHDANDWNPVWSPDGRWLYFLSNRSGSMNLWRVAIDESSGVVSGEPQSLTAPAPYVADFTLSSDGSTGVYASILGTTNISRVPFDPRTGATAGPPEAVTSGANDFAYFDVTADGATVAGATSSRGREDLYSVPTTGGAMRELTHDFYRDRSPRWSVDNRRIFFYSDRRGYNLWSIDADGASLRQLTKDPAKLQGPVPSRDGTRVAAFDLEVRQIFIYDVRSLALVETLPPFPDAAVAYPYASDWSPDDRQLAIGCTGGRGGVWVYSFDSKSYRRVANGDAPSWFEDGRRLIFGSVGGNQLLHGSIGAQLQVADVTTGATRSILALPGETLAGPRFAAHDTQLYFTRGSISGDIWLVHFGDNK